MPEPTVAIVIVSYNVRHELESCLHSLAIAHSAAATTITVVDNASTDGTPGVLRDRWPGVQVIDAGANLGFARANNLGIRATRSDLVLLLNPDTVVTPGAIPTLVDALVLDAGAAAAGPRLVDARGHPELSFGPAIGPAGELWQKTMRALYERRVPPAVRWVRRATGRPGPRAWLSGACLLLRRTDLEAVGLLDERFFMYTEDVDLCVALRARGRRVLFVPDAIVQHLRGRSVARNPAVERLRRASQIAYYEKHHPRWAPLLRAYLRLAGKYQP